MMTEHWPNALVMRTNPAVARLPEALLPEGQ